MEITTNIRKHRVVQDGAIQTLSNRSVLGVVNQVNLLLGVLIFTCMLCASAYAVTPKTHTVYVNEDGTFSNADGTSPSNQIRIRDGDTVEWRFHSRTDTIIPVDPLSRSAARIAIQPNICFAYKPFLPDEPNEFTGPLPRAPSGIFTLGPDYDNSFKIESSSVECCENNDLTANGQCLCHSGALYETMDWTWQNPAITGVFIRLRWNDVHTGPNQFDWTVLDREIAKAVENGKLYSLAFKAGKNGTPHWIFGGLTAVQNATPTTIPAKISATIPATTSAVAGSQLNNVKRLKFHDGGSNLEEGKCGSEMVLGSPTDPAYQAYYFQLLKAVADHLKEKNAWYRALAYIKPSGANLFSHENRLPKRCLVKDPKPDTSCGKVCAEKCDCEPDECICNPKVWANKGNYTPEGLYDFYDQQTAKLAEWFPDKDMSYMLIQDGFPLVSNDGKKYEGMQDITEDDLPKGAEQTKEILSRGRELYDQSGSHFVVQHNGLGPKPQYYSDDKCPNEGKHPPHGFADNDFASAGTHCPNKYVLIEGREGQVTGFQTSNTSKVHNAEELDSTLSNAWDNSDAVFVEIYEEMLWMSGPLKAQNNQVSASAVGGKIKTLISSSMVSNWNNKFHERRRDDWVHKGIPDPFPLRYKYTFKRTLEGKDDQLFYYIHGAKCANEAGGRYGVVAIRPSRLVTVTQDTSPIVTEVSGYVTVPAPGPKNDAEIPTDIKSNYSKDNRVGLKGITLKSRPCSLSMSFTQLPVQPTVNASLSINATAPGASSACGNPGSAGSAMLDGDKMFVRGIRVCTVEDDNNIRRIKGIEIYAGKVKDDGTIKEDAKPVKNFTVEGCHNWSEKRYCPPEMIAVGVETRSTESGFAGIALMCKGIDREYDSWCKWSGEC